MFQIETCISDGNDVAQACFILDDAFKVSP